MQITIFGASGRVGRLVVDEALNRGYEVVAFTHSSTLEKRKNLKVLKGDVHDADDVADAIANTEAVISVLGSWGTNTKDIVTVGTRNMIPAMQAKSIKRLVSLSGHDADAPGDKFNPLHAVSRLLFALVAPRILRDGELHMKLLAKSDLAWTVVRSPIMISIGKKNRYKLSHRRPLALATINRQALAKCLVDQIEDQKYIGRAPFISKS